MRSLGSIGYWFGEIRTLEEVDNYPLLHLILPFSLAYIQYKNVAASIIAMKSRRSKIVGVCIPSPSGIEVDPSKVEKSKVDPIKAEMCKIEMQR